MKKLAQRFLIPALILVAWWIIVKLQIFSSYLLPAPLTTWQAFLELCASGILFKHVTVSLLRVFAGFGLAVLLALPLGIICGLSRFFKEFCWSTLEFLRHVPPLAAIPLIILWFGIEEASKLVIIVLAAFFPLFLNTYSGVTTCDKKLLEVGTALHLTTWEKVRHIQLPAALPTIIIGLQLSLGYSWRALIGAELIAASSGIGYMILDAEELSRPDVVLVGVFVIGIIGTVIDEIFIMLAKRLLPWQRKAENNGY